MMRAGTIAVTGLTGYVGEVLERHARARGWGIVALTRRPPVWARDGGERRPPPGAAGSGALTPDAGGQAVWIPWSLGEGIAPHALAGARALVHLAASTTRAPDPAEERRSLQALLDACDAAATRLIFASSVAAGANNPTRYGALKAELEEMALARGAVVVRLGLVCGGPERGLYGTLCRWVDRLPVLPSFGPPPRVQPVHVADGVEALLRLASAGDDDIPAVAGHPDGRWRLVSPDAPPLHELLAVLAEGRHGARPRLVGLPGAELARWVLSRAPTGDSAAAYWVERFRSLLELPVEPDRGDWEVLGVPCRRWRTWLGREAPPGVDPDLAREARTLFAAAGAIADERAIRLYSGYVSEAHRGEPLPLPPAVHRRPALFRPATAEEARRLNAAVQLSAYADPTLYRTEVWPRTRVAGALAGALAREAGARWLAARRRPWPR